MDKFNLENLTLKNNNYRKVINTTDNMQVVLMSLSPGVEIGKEIHPDTTQFIRVEGGKCMAEFGGSKYSLKDGDAIVIPPGVEHNVWCSKYNDEDCKLYSIYTPPEHPIGTVEKRKPDSENEAENEAETRAPAPKNVSMPIAKRRSWKL